jgi:tetratricopeptide (TPR) repeat protein
MSPEEFDKQFLAWLEAETQKPAEHLTEWKKSAKEMANNLKAQKYDDVIQEGLRIRDWYPDYVESSSVYEMLADAYQGKGDKKSAREQLELYSRVGGRGPSLVKRLASLQQEAGDNAEATKTLERLNFIYPEDEDLHRRLGDLLLAQNNLSGAIREYQAVLAMKPLDQATAHYELAKALRLAHRNDDARDQVLQALEAAPGYKPAQQLLLEISK